MVRTAAVRERTDQGRRSVLLAVVSLLMLAGCAGPSLPLEVSMRKVPVDVILGEQPEDLAPVDNPGLPPSTAPGFIGAPVLLDPPPSAADSGSSPATSTPPPPSTGKPLPNDCPVADPDASVVEAAPTFVTPPRPGAYTYRREGVLRTTLPGGSVDDLLGASPQRLSTEVVREVTEVETLRTDDGPLRGTWKVVESSPGLRVTTSYLFEQSALLTGGSSPLAGTQTHAEPGLYISRIFTEREDLPGSPLGPNPPGTELFEPASPVKILDLPLVAQSQESQLDESGDPHRDRLSRDRNGSVMELFHYTKGRKAVDVCGVLVQGWEIGVSQLPDPHADFWSYFDSRDVRKYDFGGSFVFAPQYGLIVEDKFQFGGADRTNHFEWGGSGEPQRRFRMDSHAVINSVDPK